MNRERPAPSLSPREQQLLRFAAEGLTDTAISHRLGISEATVGTYWGRVRIKLGPYSRTELVALMLRQENEAEVENLRRENEALISELRGQSTLDDYATFRQLLDNAPDSMLMVNEQGKILFANVAFLELFSYESEELVGEHVLILIPERYRTHHVDLMSDYLANPDRKIMGEHLQTPALKKDGTEFFIRAALSAVQSPASTTVICAIRPIME